MLSSFFLIFEKNQNCSCISSVFSSCHPSTSGLAEKHNDFVREFFEEDVA